MQASGGGAAPPGGGAVAVAAAVEAAAAGPGGGTLRGAGLRSASSEVSAPPRRTKPGHPGPPHNLCAAAAAHWLRRRPGPAPFPAPPHLISTPPAAALTHKHTHTHSHTHRAGSAPQRPRGTRETLPPPHTHPRDTLTREGGPERGSPCRFPPVRTEKEIKIIIITLIKGARERQGSPARRGPDRREHRRRR